MWCIYNENGFQLERKTWHTNWHYIWNIAARTVRLPFAIAITTIAAAAASVGAFNNNLSFDANRMGI